MIGRVYIAFDDHENPQFEDAWDVDMGSENYERLQPQFGFANHLELIMC
jgi:hypothetical protein